MNREIYGSFCISGVGFIFRWIIRTRTMTRSGNGCGPVTAGPGRTGRADGAACGFVNPGCAFFVARWRLGAPDSSWFLSRQRPFPAVRAGSGKIERLQINSTRILDAGNCNFVLRMLQNIHFSRRKRGWRATSREHETLLRRSVPARASMPISRSEPYTVGRLTRSSLTRRMEFAILQLYESICFF